jgi:hypothetical protein
MEESVVHLSCFCIWLLWGLSSAISLAPSVLWPFICIYSFTHKRFHDLVNHLIRYTKTFCLTMDDLTNYQSIIRTIRLLFFKQFPLKTLSLHCMIMVHQFVCLWIPVSLIPHSLGINDVHINLYLSFWRLLVYRI